MSTLLQHKPTAAISPLQETALVNLLPDPVLVADAGGRLVYCNNAAEVFLGSSLRMLNGKHVQSLLTATLDLSTPMTVHDIELAGKSVSRLAVTPLGEGRVMLSLHLPAQHVSRERAEKARLALKPAQLIARTMAHEIKNPLSGIRGAAQLLARLDLGPDDRELLDLISSETDRIARLVDKVGFFDADSALQEFMPLNIHTVIDRVAMLARESFARNVPLMTDFDPSLPDICGDADRLTQMLINLVKNAAEAPSVQRITLRTYYAVKPVFHPEGGHKLPLCIEVTDDGAGIPADVIASVFDPYFTTKSQGAGLGLSVVAKVVDDHGGIIEVASTPGKTTFRISFPQGRNR